MISVARSDPGKCFCIMGRCTKERWECHNSEECKKMAKCKGKQCVCNGGSSGTCSILLNQNVCLFVDYRFKSF